MAKSLSSRSCRLSALLHMSPVLLVAPLLVIAAGDNKAKDSSWIGWGGNSYNNRWASTNTKISSSNIKSVTEHCHIPGYKGGVTATPSVANGIAYFPSWNGSLVALDYTTCKVKWDINCTQLILDYAPPDPLQAAVAPYPICRTSPQIDLDNNVIYFGTLWNALLVAADLKTGKILAKHRVHPHPLAQVTQSPTLLGDIIYLGASSVEESVGFMPNSNYTCCTFVGNAIAVRYNHKARKFTTVWDTPMMPPNDDPSEPGYWSGSAIWGSQPSIDPKRNTIFYATGNLYSVPDKWLPCTADPFHPACELPSEVWQEAVVALDLKTGKVKWVRRLAVLDAWTVACFHPNFDPNLCPYTPGTDVDFGMAPTFVHGVGKGKKKRDVVVVGQKNGNLYSLAADTGELEWAVSTGPAGEGGGLTWGIAVDDKRVYYINVNSERETWTPKPQPGPRAGRSTNGSAYGAADLETGKILWETPVPDNWLASNPPTVVGDLVLLGRRQDVPPAEGQLVVLRKTTGDILMDRPLDGHFTGGIAVVGKKLLFGSGFHGAYDGSFYVMSVK
ncbi:quinon protein alcohol dehydrogenase-like superfamily [Sordaria brevicollis]|uniref:Quinon protein alcohol dehydrogenase-like superfamily n=1 Tax=Sordaria brevicollis TaxID=83679 RepID=A0AAE0PKR4_SORBR|nr:quinon protein alcohol dehydrogenase-like superfamily [Sordaria brevicollis]